MYSRQATAKNCSPVSLVMKYCPMSTTLRNPASRQNFACVLRAPPSSHRRVLEAHLGANNFHPRAVLPRPASRTHPLPATPFQCPRSRTSTLGEEAAAPFLPLRWPDCTLSRLRAEEYDRPVTQSIATPEPSSRTIPTLDRTLVALWSLECVATLGSRRSCLG